MLKFNLEVSIKKNFIITLYLQKYFSYWFKTFFKFIEIFIIIISFIIICNMKKNINFI